jgi:hypothetical protein
MLCAADSAANTSITITVIYHYYLQQVCTRIVHQVQEGLVLQEKNSLKEEEELF